VKNGHVTSVELKKDPVISGSELSNMNLHHLQIDLLKSPGEKKNVDVEFPVWFPWKYDVQIQSHNSIHMHNQQINKYIQQLANTQTN
jgi:hypothetical protein